MADFKDILGNEILKEHFKVAVNQGKVSHAYIIEGEKGSGKKMISSAFAKILQCEKKINNDGACGVCESCIQIENYNHPDVIWVKHEKPTVISVKEIREQVVNTIDIKPYKGPYKIYIVDEAEKMNNAAQNAILKTIEEPPTYAVILLLTTNRGAFLPTILSRCILLGIKPVKDSVIKKYLMNSFQLSEEMADFCTDFAMGNIGKALDIAVSEEFLEIREFAISVFRAIHELEDYEIVEKVKLLKKWKELIQDFLDMMMMWFRDILFLKVLKKDGDIIFKNEYAILKKQSEKLNLENIEDIFQEINETQVRIKSNVNFDTSLELLLIKVRRKFL